MNRKEYIITSDLKIAQSQRNNTINRAVTTYHIGAKKLNKAAAAEKSAIKSVLIKSAELMGILAENPERWFKDSVAEGAMGEADIGHFIKQRDQAKIAKDYPRADSIRDHLKKAGVLLEDLPEGTTWRRE